jgi:hypothetical protein
METSNYDRINLVFDKIYSSYKEMMGELKDNPRKDGVFIGRFVLVNYGDRRDRNDPNSEYSKNFKNDVEFTKSNRNYDGTVWQKVVENGI